MAAELPAVRRRYETGHVCADPIDPEGILLWHK